MNIRKHVFFGVPPYGTTAFLKEKQRIKENLSYTIAWLLIGLVTGIAHLILAYKYAQADLQVPIVQYVLVSVGIIVTGIYGSYSVSELKKLRSLNKAYFQYLEFFRKTFQSN